MEKIKVLVIDDSAVVRDILQRELSVHPKIEVIATAMDPYIAREKLAKHKIDVITLDIEMPRMDGLAFLKYLMKYHPIPVIVVSSLVDKKNQASLTALELGAVDIVPKPSGRYTAADIIEDLSAKIIQAAEIDFDKVKLAANENRVRNSLNKMRYLTEIEATGKLIAIGASTGGTTALETVFKTFQKSFPPTLAVIHMPAKFTATFANRLNDICEVTVKEAEENERILPGTVYIAPGDFHMMVKAVGTQWLIKLSKGQKVQHQRPAVDVLFESVADNIGKNAIGVLLTGMGKDGAQGLLSMKKREAYTVAQDEKTSIVFGMPKAAIDIGAAEVVKPLGSITKSIIDHLEKTYGK